MVIDRNSTKKTGCRGKTQIINAGGLKNEWLGWKV